MLALDNFQKPILKYESIKVIKADSSDAEKICATVNEAYKKDVFRERTRTTIQKVEKYFRSNQHTWYVIKIKDEVVATVLYSTDQAPETGQQGNIHMLATKTSYQGKGLGTQLLKKVEKRALKEGKDKISLIAAKMNVRLCTFYQSNGYNLTGKEFFLPNFCVLHKYRIGKERLGDSKIKFMHMEKALRV